MKPVYICPHITDESTAYIGLPTNENDPQFLCVTCATEQIAKLTETMQPAAIFRLMYVDTQHATAITHALQNFTHALKKNSPERSLVRNRTQCVGRYIYNAAGLGSSRQPRFQRYRVNQDDGRGPSYRRSVIVPRLVEPKSLSSFSGVEAYNRTVTYA